MNRPTIRGKSLQIGTVVKYGYDLEMIGILGEFEPPQYRVYDGEESTLWRPKRIAPCRKSKRIGGEEDA